MKTIKRIGLFILMMCTFMLPLTVHAATNTANDVVKIKKVYSEYSDRATIKWAPVKNASKYRVYYKPYGKTKWAKLGDVSGSKTSYIHVSNKKNSLIPGKKYTYTVRGFNKDTNKWMAYDKKGKSVTISKTIRNKKYVYYTALYKNLGGLSYTADGVPFYKTGVTKVKVGKNTLTLTSSFLRCEHNKVDETGTPASIKKNFLKHKTRTFKVSPHAIYKYGPDRTSKESAMNTIKAIRGLGMTMVVKNNTILSITFGS